MDTVIGDYQSGFRPQRGTTDSMFAYQRLYEIMRDRQGTMYTAFIYFRKAFDSVDFKLLFFILRKVGIPETIVAIIENLYSNACFRVRLERGEKSDRIYPVVGVRQGCILSPSLFIILLDIILRLVKRTRHPEAVRVRDLIVELLGYADDLALVSTTHDGLQRRLDEVEGVFSRIGLLLSTEKTETMTHQLDGDDLYGGCDTKFAVNGVPLKDVDEFWYLGGGAVEHGRINSRDQISYNEGIQGVLHFVRSVENTPQAAHQGPRI